jgi:hypothetical protein
MSKMHAESFAMNRAVVIKARIVGPSTVELLEPLPERTSEIEVVARVSGKRGQGKLSDYLRSLPPGTRSAQDIDRQVSEERNTWD